MDDFWRRSKARAMEATDVIKWVVLIGLWPYWWPLVKTLYEAVDPYPLGPSKMLSSQSGSAPIDPGRAPEIDPTIEIPWAAYRRMLAEEKQAGNKDAGKGAVQGARLFKDPPRLRRLEEEERPRLKRA